MICVRLTVVLFFFFSSRRRHTRCSRDWSSDVCSSDLAYGDEFRRVVRAIGIREILTAPQSPWQNPYAERVIESIRRECLDHLIILGERHLRSILSDYVNYYNVSRPHLSLERNAPVPRSVETSALGAVVAVPQVGGLHHRYTRAA